MLSSGLLPLINQPTRITSTSKTLIDNTFTNCAPDKCKSSLLYSDISDHLPILTQLRLTNSIDSLSPNDSSHSMKSFRCFDDASIFKFKTFLSNIDWNCSFAELNQTDVDAAYNKFLDIFKSGFNSCFPLKSRLSHRYAPRKEWMTAGLVRCCLKKSKLYKTYMKSRNDEDKCRFVKYRNKLKGILIKAEKDFYSKQLQTCTSDPKKRGKF